MYTFIPMNFTPRKIKFKAWNLESKLLMRLNSIQCNKGELLKKDHVLLQFTGLHDLEGEEIYDMDIVFIAYEKFIIVWNNEKNGWFFGPVDNEAAIEPLTAGKTSEMRRFCSHFELTNKPD